MQKGFEALATASVRAANQCVDLINKVLNKVVELAAKRLNAYGFAADLAASGVQWVKQAFTHEGKSFPIPLWSDVKDIWAMINNIKRLYESIEQMVTAAQEYYKGIQQIVNTARQIPDVDSTHKAVGAVEGFGAGAQQMREAQQSFNEAKKASQQQLGGLQRAAPR
jgi:methyl-accepting chemotaxis protein